MKSQTLGVMLLTVAAPLLTSCVTDSKTESPLPTVEYSVIASGQNMIDGLYGNKKLEVFTDQASFNSALYSNIQPLVEPTVDFTTKRVVFLSLGARPTGGYSISAEKVEDHGDYNMVNVFITIPGENCIVTQAFTSPYQFIEVNSTKTILFEERLAVKSCA